MEETRICSITGEKMESGYVYQQGDMYFKYEVDLVRFLRGEFEQMMLGLTDEEVLTCSYEEGLHYYSEWFVERLD